MKKALVIVSLLALAITLGFSDTSWAVERPNTPECADVNGRSDPDACHIQYIEPLQKELEELWFQLVRLQGKKAEDNPWVFKTDNSACDQDKPEYYDEKTCKLSMPGKLAQAKYQIREEMKKTAYLAKVKRQKLQLVATTWKLSVTTKKNQDLTAKLAQAEEKNAGLEGQITALKNKLVESVKVAEDQKNRADNFRAWLIFSSMIAIFLAVLVVTSVFNKKNKP